MGIPILGDIYSAGKKLFDPGHENRKEAKNAEQNAINQWTQLSKLAPQEVQLQYGTDIKPYEVGTPLEAQSERYIDPMTAALGYGIQPYSASKDATSAYGDLGPSSWQNASSAYKNLGPSAASKLGFNKDDLARMGESSDYFRNLTKTGSDPIAEADYQRRAAQAEQSRKANTDAALAAMEAKGMGNAGGALSARVEGAQNAANDRYQAGLDATALAAQRRDTAAQAGAGIASQMGQNQFSADAARAEAVDRYNQARAQGLDEASARRASGLDAFNTTVAGGQDQFAANQWNAADAWANQRYNDVYGLQQRNADRAQSAAEQNFNRANNISDTNIANQNQTTQFNKVEAPQTFFNNQMAVTAGKTGQMGQLAGIQQQQAERPPWYVPLAQSGANIAKAAG